MSITCREDLLKKERKRRLRFSLILVGFLSVQVPAVWLPVRRKFMMR